MPEQIITLSMYQKNGSITGGFNYIIIVVRCTLTVVRYLSSVSLLYGKRTMINGQRFFSCFNSISRSSTLKLFSFTIKETALLKEPSKYPLTKLFIVDLL